MKCPKCGYLGFETTDRCRHCGYDFSLLVSNDPASELPLRSSDEIESVLADFDLDRVIGEPEPDAVSVAAPAAAASPPPTEVEQYRSDSDGPALPLFTRPRSGRADSELIAPPPPAGAPLAVRRATPEVTRRRTPRVVRRDEGLDLQLDPSGSSEPPEQRAAAPTPAPATASSAPTARRVTAAAVDMILLGSINVAVLYLTLAIAGLSMPDVLSLPLIPMGAFLLLLNGGYLVAFTAASGQTIGKMLLGVRVIGDADGRVDIGGAVLRSAGVLFTIVTFGIAYLPVLVSRDGRALHDRLAGTRVVKHA